MTNYNERLDVIIADVSGESFDAAITNPNDYAQVVLHAENKAKQAITSLIKGLVAEAKPERNVVITVVDKVRNNTIDEFEQNLLKALEEK